MRPAHWTAAPGFLFCFLHPSLCFFSSVSFTLFIRNADELKPHSISWVSFLHLFNTLISQFSLHPTTCSLISCSDGKESGGVDWLVLSQGPFGPVFSALQVCVNTLMKPSVVHPNVASLCRIAAVYVQNSSAGYLFYPLPLLGIRHIWWCLSRPRL